MKAGIAGIVLAIILALLLCVPAVAQNSTGEVAITMNTEEVLGITLDKEAWLVGDVSSNTTYKTDLPATWCTITNAGNANVNIHIKGDDAKWVDVPTAYKWTLSADEVSGAHEYVLWYHIAGDKQTDEGKMSYTLITTTEEPMKWTRDGSTLNLHAYGEYEQFGLKLLTPTFFYSGRTMSVTITISAVAA